MRIGVAVIFNSRSTVLAAAGLVCLSGGLVAAHPGIDQQIADVTARLEAAPDDASLWLRRGELHRIHRDWDLALADFRRAADVAPADPVVDLHLARLHLDRGEAAKALEHGDRYVARTGTGTAAQVVRARALVALGRPLDAARAYSAAIDAADAGRPRPDDYLERARALRAAGPEYRGEAIRGLDAGIERLGAPITLIRLAIELELEAGRVDAALARLDDVARGAPRKERWLAERGDILADAGRIDAAREAYRSALAALETLPASRRRNAATARLERRVRDALAALAERP